MSEDVHMAEVPVAGIYVINLDARPERWELFQEGSDNWGTTFGKKPVRLSAVAGIELDGFGALPWFRDRIKERRRNSWAGKAGAILSHRKAIEYAHGQGWGNVLIVEDDAFITDEKVRVWNSGLSNMVASLPDDWAVVYLYTAQPFGPCCTVAEKESVRLIEAMGAFGCVAYLLNSRIFGKLLAELPEGKNIWPWVARHKAIDLWFSRHLRRFGRVYVVAPSLVGHQVGPSDITMTPESEWTFSGEMEGLACTQSTLLFSLKKALRNIEWIYQECLSFFRMQIKRVRGL